VILARRLSIATLLGLALSVQSLFAQGAPHRNKIDKALTDALVSGAKTARVIVTMEPGFRDGVRDALKKHGDVIKAEYPSIESIAAIVHSEDITELANHPGIKYVSADATVYAGAVAASVQTERGVVTSSFGLTTSGTEIQSTLRQTLGLSAKPTPTSVTGAGITVAIIDSGIDARRFGKRITAFYDFTRGGIPSQPYDDYGHGTHIAGLIGEDSGPFLGVAPNVNYVGLKVLDKDGQGSTSDVIKALEYVTANRARLGVQIVNVSLGHPVFAPASHDPLVAAVERAADAGLIVVASAGNFGINQNTGLPGYTGITSPGNAPSALTSGATDTKNTTTRDDDVVAPYSSRGPSWFDGIAKPDFVAPGTRLVSDAGRNQTLYNLLPLNQVTGLSDRQYLQLSGTSMAAGVTSGVVALVLDAHNRAGYVKAKPLSPNAVRAILEYSAIPVNGFDVLTQGTGQINANGAIALASAIDTGAGDGAYWLRSGVTGFSTIGGIRYEWSKQIIWGNQLLVASGDASTPLYYDLKQWTLLAQWGDNIVWGTADDNIVWGTAADNIVWGTADDNIVWGTNIVWGDRLIGQRSGDNIVWGTSRDGDNIVWGTMSDDNIVWGTMAGDNIVWGTMAGDNVVWGTMDGDNIVWGTDADNIIWGTSEDNIVWGTNANSSRLGGIF
jgi:serine protease AprX